MTDVVALATEHARALRAGETRVPTAFRGAKRVVAIGDPQTSSARFLGALAAHGLLDDHGWLRPDARLVAMGDYFDYFVPEREHARIEGVLVLEWLAAHPREQVTLMFGNHDAARVMELVTIDDARFFAAGDLAREIYELPREQRTAAETKFREQYPELATTGYAGRDYNAFTVEQRRLVQRLLLANRFDLAVTERTADGTLALVTHAGITTTQLDQLELAAERDPRAIAAALSMRLKVAVAAVAGEWNAGRPAALSLEPLHVAGSGGQEGGGMLYHRPADPDRPGADREWELSPRAARRFDPRELPRGLAQIIAHTGHSKAFKELPRWREPGMDDKRGGIRTLRATADGTVTYRRGIHAHDERAATAWMIDPEMHYVPSAADVAVLRLAP